MKKIFSLAIFTLLITVFFAWIGFAESFLGGAAIPTLPTYRIGPGDVLDIRVVDSEEWNMQVEVRPDGRISYPATGEIIVAGLSIEELTQKLTYELGPGKRYLKNPQVIINVVRRRPLIAYVLGEVARPGPIELSLGFESARKLLSIVGGPTPQADLRHVKVYRGDGRKQEFLDLQAGLESGETDTVIWAGDVVIVPKLDVQQVGVLGAVGKPGQLTLPANQSKIDLLSLLLEAGGLSQPPEKSEAVILRANGKIEPVDLVQALNKRAEVPELGNGDVLWVRPKGESYFVVLGAVRSPGRFPYQEGLKLGDILATSGQLTEQADAGNVLLLHADGSREILDLRPLLNGEQLEVAKKLILPDDLILVPRQEKTYVVLGGVQKPGVFPWNENIKLADALAIAGGPTPPGGNTAAELSRVLLVRRTAEETQPIVMELDARELLQGRNETANVKLQPNDVVYVPTKLTREWQDKLAFPMFLLGIATNLRYLFR